MIDVIIPTYKPGKEVIELIAKLDTQSIRPDHIIIMNTEKAYFDKLLSDNAYSLDTDWVKVTHITKSEFDHGRTRNAGVMQSDADVFVMMTQDAEPYDDKFIENIVKPLGGKVGACFARQLARDDASIAERLTRDFNYPAESSVKSAEDVDRLGIKAYFCSNVSCAYVREIYDSLGGFVDHTLFNEDMIYACSLIKAGYSIAYAGDARVYHSHNYSGREQFHRNVDIGVSQADHPEVFAGLSSESEGKKMVITTIKTLIVAGHPFKVFSYGWQVVCRYAGFLIGKNYKKLPLGFIKKVSMSPGYFD